jgi:SAM-dependent methyltransferase
VVFYLIIALKVSLLRFNSIVTFNMQSERTLRFWDDYYNSQEPSSPDKEWILQPSQPLLERLSQCLEKRGNCRILEIGCGTSSLGRELWKYMRVNTPAGEEQESSVHLLATDVSEVCIRLNQDRDSGLIDQGENASIEYKVLNITESHPELEGKFDFILDKCCLDTLLFRSRQRGGELVRSVIDNIQSWLSEEGVYVILSPRSKFKMIRDYAGFSSVERFELDPAKMQRGYLEGEKDETGSIYLHVSRKNPAYSSSVNEATPATISA